jgi:hypothetical protein
MIPDFSTEALLSTMAWLIQSGIVPFLLAVGTTIGSTVLIWVVERADDFAP